MGWAVRRPVTALVAWFLLLVALGAAAAGGSQFNDSFALPGVQSTTAEKLLTGLGSGSPAAATGRVVWSPATGDVTAKAVQEQITPALQRIATLPAVACVSDPYGTNRGRTCPKAAPTDYAAALDAAVTDLIAKELRIPPSKVSGVVALIDQAAPIASASPQKLAAVAAALPEIARLASAPRSVLDALASLTPEQLNFLVGISPEQIEQATQAVGGLAAFADLPPATLAALAKADPAALAAFAAALPQDVAGLEAFMAELKAAIAKDPALGQEIVALAQKLGISPADLREAVQLINAIAPIAQANPAKLAAIARALPELAKLASADKATIDALAKLTPQDLSFLVGLTPQDIQNITVAFGGLAQFARLPPRVLAALAAADPAQLSEFAASLPASVAEVEKVMAAAKGELAALEKAATATQKALSPISPDKRVAYATITFTSDAPTTGDVGDVLDIVDETNSSTLTVGAAGSTLDNGPSGPDLSSVIGLVAALVILLIAFGSLVAAGLPLVVAVTGLVGGILLMLVTTRFIDVASFAPTLAGMIGLGVGIDYSLFVISRFTQEVRAGAEPHAAVLTAVGTAGRAVLFAGSTVIIALLGMFVLGISFFNGLAVAAAATVVMVMASAVWMMPALLSLLGAKALALKLPWARHPRVVDPDASRWSQYGALLQRAPIVPALICLAVIGFLALPVTGMRLGFPDDGSAAPGTPMRTGYDLMSQGFGPGVNGPFFVAVQTTSADEFRSLEKVVAALESTKGVASTLPSSAMLPLVKLDPQVFKDGVTSVIVQPTTGPADPQTEELLNRIRGETTQRIISETGADIYVGGAQATAADFTSVLSKALPLFLLLVVGLGFVALMLLFHSLVIPLTAAVTSLLSFAAALGITVSVFQEGKANSLLAVPGTGPILPFLPIMVFAILFGLSMDYQVFLASRMREEWEQAHDNRDAVRRGLAGSGKVVVAAATIMSCVFLAFVPTPNGTIKMFGVALAAAVIVDAFIVRLVLVPSVMSLLGTANWWLPGWLDRILPTIRLEQGGQSMEPAQSLDSTTSPPTSSTR